MNEEGESLTRYGENELETNIRPSGRRNMNTRAFSKRSQAVTTVSRIVLIVFLIGAVGCSSTKQSRNVVKSGFLDDYSILRKGEKGEALLIYKNPIAEWKKYTKVIIDPVQLWMGKSSPLHDVPPRERSRLVTRLRGILQDKLLPDYSIVLQPGPNVMQISVALTEANPSGLTGYSGAASIEAKITDAELNTLLVAAVDRRSGRLFSSEGTALEESFQYWASTLRYRLCQWRGQQSCVQPKA